MIHQYISLGSACDTAMIFERLKIRKNAFPFDWLWNMDSGLQSILQIIDKDFSQIIGKDSYSESIHDRLPNKVTVYKEFPSIIHIHSNPMLNHQEHETILRRVNRFKKVVSSDAKIHFVYYKNFNEELLKNASIKISDTINNMINLAEEFIELMEKKGKNRRQISLLLILQTSIEYEEIATRIIKESKTKSDRIKIGFTITRYDDDKKLNRLWEKQWYRNILFRTEMPIHLFVWCNLIILLRIAIKPICELPSKLRDIPKSART